MIVIVLLFGISMYTVVNYSKNSNKSTVNFSSNINTSSNDDKDNNNQKSPKIKAANFTLQDLNGNKISLNNFKGKKVFFNFTRFRSDCSGQVQYCLYSHFILYQ